MSSNGICSFPTLKGPLIGSSDKRDILQFAFSTGRVILILLASSGIFSGIKPRLTKNSEVQVGEYLRFKISSSLQSTESCKLIFKSEKVFVIRSLRINVVFSSKDNFKNLTQPIMKILTVFLVRATFRDSGGGFKRMITQI